MQTINELLSRIRFDPSFGQGQFELGYVDHNQDALVRVDFSEVVFQAGNKFSFQVLGSEGIYIEIPFHRVRAVYKNGFPIWQRPDEQI